MSHRSNIWSVLLLIALGFNLGIGLAAFAQTQDVQRDYLPLVAYGFDAQAPSVVTLVGHDTTFVAAALIPGTCRVIVTYIDRQHGNKLHVTEDVGDRLVEIALPQEMAAALTEVGPQDELPSLKDASGFPLIVCDELYIYANTRRVDNGPFVLVRLEMPIPAPPAQ